MIKVSTSPAAGKYFIPALLIATAILFVSLYAFTRSAGGANFRVMGFSAAIAGVGYFFFWRYRKIVDAVCIDGGWLVIKNRGKEEYVEFKDVVLLDFSSLMGKRTVTLGIPRSDVFGSEICYMANAILPPYKKASEHALRKLHGAGTNRKKGFAFAVIATAIVMVTFVYPRDVPSIYLYTAGLLSLGTGVLLPARYTTLVTGIFLMLTIPLSALISGSIPSLERWKPGQPLHIVDNAMFWAMFIVWSVIGIAVIAGGIFIARKRC